MKNKIVSIPTDREGNKLYLKDLRVDKDKIFVKYKSTYNDVGFMETEIFSVDNNYVITGDDGTILYRFSAEWLNKLEN